MKNTHQTTVFNILKTLKKNYPTLPLSRHIVDATSDYNNLWGLSDKELSYALEKYEKELSINQPPSEEEINTIIQEGMDLEHIFDEEEEDY